MWGSDWPVIELAGGLSRWHQASHELMKQRSAAERDAVFDATAARFYQIEE
jgi:L-fuconolactonase